MRRVIPIILCLSVVFILLSCKKEEGACGGRKEGKLSKTKVVFRRNMIVMGGLDNYLEYNSIAD